MYIKRIYFVQRYINNKSKAAKLLKSTALKEEGYDMISTIEKTLENKNVTFFIDFGSLLGIIRDGKLIEYDDDVDYGIDICESFTWNDLEQLLSGQGFKLIKQFSLDGNITEQTYIYKNIKVDFFQHFKDNLGSYIYRFFRKNGYIYSSKYEHHVYKIYMETVKQTKAINIGKIKATVPNNYIAYLESLYTDKWTEEKRNWQIDMYPGFTKLDSNKIAYIEYFNCK